jgi:hypothetical protein
LHLEQPLEHRVVRGVAAAGDRPDRGHVEDPVPDVALVDVHADDLTDDQMAVLAYFISLLA